MIKEVTIKGIRLYADEFGNIFNSKMVPIRQYVSANGYKYIVLNFKGKRKNVLSHRIIASAFLYRPKNKNIVNHLNRMTTCNIYSNLEWTDFKGNANYAPTRDAIKRSAIIGGRTKIVSVSYKGTSKTFGSIHSACRYTHASNGNVSAELSKSKSGEYHSKNGYTYRLLPNQVKNKKKLKDKYIKKSNKAKDKNFCIDCGIEICKTSKRCEKCAMRHYSLTNYRQIEKDDLEKNLIKNKGNFVKTAKIYGISDNALRKWCKKYSLPTHSKQWKMIMPT